MTATVEKMVKIEQIADMLGVCTKTVYRMRDRGDLPPPDFCRGRLLRWKPETITNWMEG